MYEEITEYARKAMQSANQEAIRYNHEYIGSEHILLGLLGVRAGVAANVLLILGFDERRIRFEVEKFVLPGPAPVGVHALPYTPRAKKVMEHAIDEAHALNHRYIGTEHLLLGILSEGDNVAAQVLLDLGLSPEIVRAEVLNLMGQTQVSGQLDTSMPVLLQDGEKHQMAAPPKPELQHLPESAQKIAAEFDCQIDGIKVEKEKAVSLQEWDKAGERRALELKLRKLRDDFVSRWPKA